MLRQRGWPAFDSVDNGDNANDIASHAMAGERGMMVAMGHGLRVCFGVYGETTKNKEESKIVNVSYGRAYSFRGKLPKPENPYCGPTNN